MGVKITNEKAYRSMTHKATKLVHYLYDNINGIIGNFVFAVAIVYFVLPLILSVGFIKEFLLKPDRTILFVLFIILSGVCFIIRDYFVRLWRRYKNTFFLESPPFLIIDNIVVFFVIFLPLAVFKHPHFFRNHSDFAVF